MPRNRKRKTQNKKRTRHELLELQRRLANRFGAGLSEEAVHGAPPAADGDGPTLAQSLASAGVEVPPADTLDDEALHTKLWEVIEALDQVDVVVVHTDHLSDRELYHYLCTQVLPDPAPTEGVTCFDPIHGYGREDMATFVRYYATEEEREHWRSQFPKGMPERETPPYDRDRLLPKMFHDPPPAGGEGSGG